MSLAAPRLLAALAAAAVLVSLAPVARAQCALTNGPTKFDPPASPFFVDPIAFPAGNATNLSIFTASGQRRLVMRYAYGYAVYSLAAPQAPTYLDHHNLSAVGASYFPPSDAFYTVSRLLAAPDGSRLLVGYHANHGTLLMSPTATRFDIGGDYFPGWFSTAGALALDALPGGRWLAYTLIGTGAWVADVTSFLSGPAAFAVGQIPSQAIGVAPVSSLVNNGTLLVVGAKRLLVYSTGFKVVVLDVSNPGPPGSIPNAFSVAKQLLPSDFGLPAADLILNLSAAVHPIDGKLYVLAETSNASSGTSGVALLRSADGVSFSAVGAPYLPPAPYSGALSRTTTTALLLPTASDLLALFWEKSGAGVNKLFVHAASSWGLDRSAITVDSNALPEFSSVSTMGGFLQGATAHLYIGTGSAGFTLGVDVGTCTGGAKFHTLAPCRVLDTRDPNGPLGGPALGANTVRSFPVLSACALPATARCLAANVTVTGPSHGGDLRLFPAGAASPPTSVINFLAGQTRANNAIVCVGTGGQVSVQCDMPAGATHAILDVVGYFE